MSYLLDSDVVADWLRGRSSTVELIARLSDEGLAISSITYGEIYEGVYFGRDPGKAESAFRDFLRFVDVVPLSRPAMRLFARIRGDLRRRGQLVSDLDILIAATAIERDLTLITRNIRHYERIQGLRLLRPDGDE